MLRNLMKIIIFLVPVIVLLAQPCSHFAPPEEFTP
jgi:hypothetical protein